MEEISVILKNNTVTTVAEFDVLDNYAQIGKTLFIIERKIPGRDHVIRKRAIEYIFDPESLLIFCTLSNNILAKWNTDDTRNLNIGQEYKLNEVLYISPYYPRTIDIVQF